MKDYFINDKIFLGNNLRQKDGVNNFLMSFKQQELNFSGWRSGEYCVLSLSFFFLFPSLLVKLNLAKNHDLCESSECVLMVPLHVYGKLECISIAVGSPLFNYYILGS